MLRNGVVKLKKQMKSIRLRFSLIESDEILIQNGQCFSNCATTEKISL